MVTAQGARPVHPAPDQPEKMLPFAGVAVNVTVPGRKPAEHVVGQLIPTGLLVTVPVPVPDTVTVNPVPAVKVGVTDTAAFMVTVHVPVPVQPPLQPLKK